MIVFIMSKKVGKYEYTVSPAKDKKLRVIVNGKAIDFGDLSYSHYKDKTGLLDKKLNHSDRERRKNYLARASNIINKTGKKTANNPHSANYHAIKVLW